MKKNIWCWKERAFQTYFIRNSQCFPKVRAIYVHKAHRPGILPSCIILCLLISDLKRKQRMWSNYAECYLKVADTAHEAMKFTSFIYFKLNYADIKKVLKAVTCFTLIDFQSREGGLNSLGAYGTLVCNLLWLYSPENWGTIYSHKKWLCSTSVEDFFFLQKTKEWMCRNFTLIPKIIWSFPKGENSAGHFKVI